jgi:CubicO group peptidase (beta-lactamase class C family)
MRFWTSEMLKLFAAGLVFAAFASNVHAAEKPTLAKEVDALFSSLVKTNDAGLAVLVSQNGKILFEKGYGMADREHLTPVDTKTKFRIGSITKQFTAAAILKLQEERKLSIDDKLSKYIPDFPRGSEVTLRHLLTHTSGIHNYTGRTNFTVDATNAIGIEELINSFKREPYDFAPGEKWLYDNSGYVLLSYIVEKVSGKPYPVFLRNTFFRPLGMADTGVNPTRRDLARAAVGYSCKDGKFDRAVSLDASWIVGAGDLDSTVEDLQRWNEAVFRGKVLNQASLKTAFTPVKTRQNQDDDSGDGYGCGWFVSNWRGLLEISHGGDMPGFNSFLLRLPKEKFTVIILANSAPGAHRVVPDTLAHDLVKIYLRDKLAPLPVPNENVSPKAFDAVLGRYDFEGQILVITKDGNHLFGQFDGEPKVELFPASETEFFWKAVYARIKFVKDARGNIVKAIFRINGETLYGSRLGAEPK